MGKKKNPLYRLLFALLFFPKIFFVALPYWLITGDCFLQSRAFYWPLRKGIDLD